MRSDADRHALQEVLENLETRLEAYLVEWRRRLDIQDRTKPSIDRDERRQAAPERENDSVGSVLR